MELGRDMDKRELESIYDGDLSLKQLIKNPILKPMAAINKSYENLESGINRSLYEFQEKYNKIKELLDENPKYGETMLVTIILNMMEYVKHIVHSQDLQKQNMKDAINEMINIVGEYYAQVNEDEDEFEEEEPVVATRGRPIKKPIPKVLVQPEKQIYPIMTESPTAPIEEPLVKEVSIEEPLIHIEEPPIEEVHIEEPPIEEVSIEEPASTEYKKPKKEYRSDLLDKNIPVPE